MKGDHMSVEALQCKECRRAVPARGPVRLRALLRPARGGVRLLGARRRVDQAADPGRAASRSGATPTSCRSRRAPRSPLAAGVTPLVRADRLAERLGLGEVWVKNDAANPTHSFKDRVVTWRWPRRGSWATRWWPAPPPATWPTPWPRTPRRPASSRTCSSRPTSRSRRSSPPASTAPTSWPCAATTTT